MERDWSERKGGREVQEEEEREVTKQGAGGRGDYVWERMVGLNNGCYGN